MYLSSLNSITFNSLLIRGGVDYMNYRPSRNIEASIIDYLTTNLDADWTTPTVNVEKTFANVSGDNLPVVLVRTSDVDHEGHEIGSSLTKRFPLMLIDVYCKNDGQKLDIVDYLVKKLKAGLLYYTYAIADGVVQTKTLAGRIRVELPIRVTHVDLNVDKSDLSVVDRFHSLISLSCSINILE